MNERAESIKRALNVATAAALAAGARIREEFYRENGPRGGGDHAVIDDEIEPEIRKALLDAFPDWSYLGEETGSHEGTFPARWVVDPNDGTKLFLKGVRGSSVAIGLLWEQQPVLGVVYSPLYPDDSGDLFTWAEGCGPLLRNGTAVAPPHWPEELEASHTVLVSQSGDHALTPNCRCAHPARFRTMVSIAYRFALVAAGEAVAGVSLAAPAAHDFAGCHALLRGQRAVLVDERGQEVVYEASGRARVNFCFAGGPSICRELARRPWASVFGGDPSRVRGDLSFPTTAGRPLRNQRLVSRALGCWLGQLTGDSLGSLVEFRNQESIAACYPRELADGGTWNTLAGQPTDDSELALCLARTLVRDGGYDRAAVWRSYRGWYLSMPFDIGATTSQALSREEAPSATRSIESQANGALMRCSPLALASWNDEERALAWSDQDASITHPNAVCLGANRAFLAAVIAGLNGADPDQMHARALAQAEGPVRSALERATEVPPSDFSHQMGWVLLALQNAFFQLLHARSLEEGVIDTVRRGGDTDTNGCIAGALLGAYHGLPAIPAQWRLAVLSCRPAAAFAAARRRRPDFLWPVDAHELAERLLTLG